MASLFFTVLTVVSAIFCLSSTNAQKYGFRAELIHRDSPKSPFYNPKSTITDRAINMYNRSIYRTSHFSPNSISTQTVQTDIQGNRGEYLMDISLGTPPVRTVAIADTGSDLIWTQCKPCPNCFEQVDPLFDPASSSTYKTISCSASKCSAVPQTGCSAQQTCEYAVKYGDQSYSNGDLAVETLTLGSGRGTRLPNIVFGCGHDNQGTFNEKDTGIVGLGGGEASLISQLSTSIDGKFSYCLVPLGNEASSVINFGTNAIVSGDDVLTTPLIRGSPDTYYYLTLEAISVNNKKISISGSSFESRQQGNIIIDSGTTLTILPEEVYSQLEEAVAAAIPLEKSSPVGGLQLCYEGTFKIPNVTVHFDGADVKLAPINLFVQVSDTAFCFAFAPATQISIYGNLAQQNFLVGYDLVGQTVSFKPMDCSL